MPKETRYFIQGMDSDTEDRLLPKEKYRYAFMIRPGQNKGKGGVAYVEQGNTLIPYNLPTGTNVCVAEEENEKNNTILYMVYNSNQNHLILEFDPATNSINEVLAPNGTTDTSFLNFANKRIHSINIYDDVIAWVDDRNMPRQLNIESAKAYMRGDASTRDLFVYDSRLGILDTDYQNQYLSAGKYPPLFPPSWTYGSDTNKKTNYLRGNMFQFMYRYVYYDYSRSTFSPVSKITLPQGEETLLGFLPNSSQINNYLDIGINLGHSTVIQVEIAFRKGNTGEWYLIQDEIKKVDQNNTKILADDIAYNYRWYGTKVGYALPDTETTLNYYAVPQIAKVQELTNENVLFYANYIQGYDNIDINVLAAQSWEELSYDSLKVSGLVLDTDGSANGTNILELPASASDIPVGSVIQMTIQGSQNNLYRENLDIPYDFFIKNIIYVVKSADLTTYPANLLTSLSVKIEELVSDVDAIVDVPNRQVLVSYIGTKTPYFVKLFQLNGYKQLPTKRASWKKGANQSFGIVYFDEQGRHGGVNKSGGTNLYVPWYTEQFSGGTAMKYWDVKIFLELRHQAPSWAKTYQIVYGGSDIDFFMSGVGEIEQVPFSGSTSENDKTYSENEFIINVGGFYNHLVNNEGVQYTFSQGDKLRYASWANSTLANYTEVEIKSFDPATKQFICTVTEQNKTSDIYTGVAIFEIFRRKLGIDDIVYREIGEAYPIIEDNGNYYHQTNDRNQSASVSARLVLEGGDAYVYPIMVDYVTYESNILRLPEGSFENKNFKSIIKLEIKLENNFFSPLYDSTNTDIGRLHVYSENFKQRRYQNKFIYGGKYFHNSQNNTLYAFDPNNEGTVGIENGEIQRMVQVGFTLKIIQNRKITSAYLSRQLAVNPGGTDGIILSDRFVGELREAIEDWGTQHPNSVMKVNRYLYMWDAANGVVVKDDANGPDSVSTKSFTKTIRDLSETYKAGTIVSGYDKTLDLLFFTLKSSDISETISFVNKPAYWNAHHPYTPEAFSSSRQTFVSFRNGQLWLHNSGAIGNFYGVQYKAKVRVIFNENPKNTKTWRTLSIHSNKKWYAPEQGDIKTEDTDMYEVMETRLLSNKVKYQERVFYADIPRDMNTNTPNPIINGHRLKSSVLDVTLITDSEEETSLFAIDANYTNNTEI